MCFYARSDTVCCPAAGRKPRKAGINSTMGVILENCNHVPTPDLDQTVLLGDLVVRDLV